MIERKCFVYGGFGYITWYCKNRKEIEENKKVEVGGLEHRPSNNKFEVLTSRVIEKKKRVDSYCIRKSVYLIYILANSLCKTITNLF